MNKGLSILCAAFLSNLTLVAQQENDSTTIQMLDEVVVSDSRFALKRENSGKTVITISAEELSRFQGRNIAEVITTKSGLELTGARSREGAVFGVFARGGRGRQVLIFIDGVRVSDPSSFSQEYDLRLLSAANVESVEIIKGAASTLYGTNAATAVINIKTKDAGASKIGLTLQSMAGTNQNADDQNFNLSRSSNSGLLSGTLNRITYKVGFSNRFAEGLSDIVTVENEKDGFSHFSADAQLGYSIADKFKVAVYANQTRLRTDFDESFGLSDAPYRFTSEQERLGLSASFDYGKGQFHANGAYAKYSSESVSAFPSTFDGSNYNIDLYNKYIFNDRFYSIVGLHYLEDKAELETVQNFRMTDPYVNAVFVSEFGLNLNFGARLNNHSEYGSKFVYNFNPSFTLKSGDDYFKLLASYATSYITPSLTQLFGSFGANPDLEPEDNRTIEGGLEYASNSGFRANVLYFNRKEENFVFYDLVENGYKNAENSIDAQGVEFEIQYKPTTNVELYANYTFTERKGDNAIRIPKHKVNATLGYHFTERSFASLGYNLTGNRLDTDFSSFPSNDVSLGSFQLVNLFASHAFIPDVLKVFLNVDNLLNEKYTEVLGFTTRGRNLSIGFQLNLQ